MSKQDQHWLKSRYITERIVVEGNLELLTPAHFGSGDTEGAADLSLLRDACDGSALLPGASIAGALRNYWRERKYGYGAPAVDSELFGAKRGARDEMEGSQSLLIVEDAFGPQPQIELRDGVKINSRTRTAEEQKLFDMELLRVGTRFKLRFELLVSAKPLSMSEDEYSRLSQAEQDDCLAKQRRKFGADLALALQGFEKGEIGLGARKRRGFGRCHVQKWRVRRYDLTTSDGLLAWLAEGRTGDEWSGRLVVSEVVDKSLAEILGVSLDDAPDKRHRFEMEAEFALDGSLLVRSGFGQADQGPDAIHLHRPYYGEADQSQTNGDPVLPGTSLAGALRARALRIANTLTPDRVKAEALINELFGVGPEDVGKEAHQASRLLVHESVIENVHTLVQSRIRVDRFTGGAMDNYLFNEAPVFGGENSKLELELALRNPQDYEVGLLLLLLKDLWTGDLPLGGESGVGRGRLRGREATLTQVKNGASTEWIIKQDDKELKVTAVPELDDVWQSLEDFVETLNRRLMGGV